MFDLYDARIASLASEIYQLYVRRFIRHEEFQAEPDKWSVMRKCHSWYIDNKKQGISSRVTEQLVLSKLKEAPPVLLNRLVKSSSPVYASSERPQEFIGPVAPYRPN